MNEKLTVEITAEIKSLQEELKKAGYELLYFRDTTNSSIEGITLKSLTEDLKLLNKKFEEVEIGSDEFNRLGKEIDAVQAKINNSTKTFKSASSGFNTLGTSINQITREFPAFAFSAQTGFLAISNNIPMLVDEINRLKQANLDLAASGQPTKSIFGQLTSALFSFQTAISLGVTLLTLYGGKLVEFFQELNSGNSTIDETEAKINALNSAYESSSVANSIGEYVKLIGALDQVKKGLVTQKDFLDKYNKTVGGLTTTVNTFEEAEKAIISQTDAYVNAIISREAANVIAKEAANTLIELNKAKAKSEKEFLTVAMAASATQFKDVKDGAALLSEIRKQEAEERKRLAKEAKEAEIKNLEDSYKKQLELVKSFQTNFKTITGDKDTKTKTPTSVQPKVQLEGLEKAPQFLDSVNQKTLELVANMEKLDDTSNMVFKDPAMEQYIGNIQNMVQLLGSTLTSAFDAALISGQNFGQVLIKAIGDLIKRLIAAVATAAILSAILASFGITPAALGGGAGSSLFGTIFKGLSGFGGAGTGGNRIASVPQIDTGGSVSFEIRGDKLYGVLQNYQTRLDRLQ